jgi:hypothetical protein
MQAVLDGHLSRLAGSAPRPRLRSRAPVSDRQATLGRESANGYGAEPDTWRQRGIDPSVHTSFDALDRYVLATERTRLRSCSLPDSRVLGGDMAVVSVL